MTNGLGSGKILENRNEDTSWEFERNPLYWQRNPEEEK
jgi:hypothetical protein